MSESTKKIQYNININQLALVTLGDELGIKFDLKDATIINFVKEMSGATNQEGKPYFKPQIINDKVFYHFDYQMIIDRNPLLQIENKKVLGRKIDKLVQCQIFDKYTEKKDGGTKIFLSFGLNYSSLVEGGRLLKSNQGRLLKSNQAGYSKVTSISKNINNTIDTVELPPKENIIGAQLEKSQTLNQLIDLAKKPVTPKNWINDLVELIDENQDLESYIQFLKTKKEKVDPDFKSLFLHNKIYTFDTYTHFKNLQNKIKSTLLPDRIETNEPVPEHRIGVGSKFLNYQDYMDIAESEEYQIKLKNNDKSALDFQNTYYTIIA